ncbi:hypothetical protein B0H13DRAFT_2065165 [Mycena leptocephala]|nr:hypothetical protein B0H13DRAFT_2065165 [Mycena leptocephala]
METIRLEIKLGGPDNYEIDVKGTAREAGFVWGEVVSKKYADDSSDGEDGSDDEGGDEKDKDKDKDAKDKKDADGDVDMDADGKPKAKKAKSKKKSKAAAEYYDVSDPFIDDSELAIDERTYFAQTKQKGFYVSSGEVALVRDKCVPEKAKVEEEGRAGAVAEPAHRVDVCTQARVGGAEEGKVRLRCWGVQVRAGLQGQGPGGQSAWHEGLADPARGRGRGQQGGRFWIREEGVASAKGKGKEKAEMDEGGEEAVIAAMKGKWKERVSVNGANGSVNGDQEGDEGEIDGDDEVGKKRKRAVNGGGDGTKKRKTVDIASFHPDLQAGIEKMKQAIAAESWETKSKFPPNLKPLLAALSLQAITLDEYDDNFFNLMPTIFPYNKFTMSKLIKRTIFHDHTALLNQRQDEILEQLKVLATEGFPKAQEEWEKSLQNYGVGGAHKARDGGPRGARGSAGLSSAGDGDKDKDGKDGKGKGEKGDEKEGGPGKGGAHHGPPLKKYRMTEAMKAAVWQLVLLSNEICRLENEKNSLEGSVLQVSEQGLRKVLYQRIVSAFPDGWMSSGQISRDVSAMKKKYEKEAQDD